MSRLEPDNKFFSTYFFPAYTSPKRVPYPIHRKFWTRLNEDVPLLAMAVKVLLVYMLFRVVKRVVLCLMPGLFDGTCWMDVIRNMFKCKEETCPRPRCPMRECAF